MSLIEELKHLRIPFEDIKEATENFTTLIGRGGYGPVYRGELSLSGELIMIAVKQLQYDNLSGQGLKEFLTEIQLLSRYKHQNIISFVGFCIEGNKRFLIYECAKNGSLNNYLKPTKSRCPLTWRQRISICVDAARGVDHLHNHVAKNQRVIHRDIKSANILLDHNWKAMISDFGLSKIGRANESITYIVTNACGTYGYCDPAYIASGLLTKESDTYSFGVVLLEVLRGRLCFSYVDGDLENHLAPLAQRLYKLNKLDLIIDGVLKKYMNSYSMNIFLETAFECLQDDRKQRPSMGLVLQKLEKALKSIESEEAPEIQELEEALGVQKLVETLQMQFESEEEKEKPKVKNLPTSNVEWDNLLPSDYKQFINNSNKETMKTPKGDVIIPTKEEAYSILSKGLLIKVNDQVNMWFWITGLNGKKCFMLPPTLLSFGTKCLMLPPTLHLNRKQLVTLNHIPSKNSRIKTVLHLPLSEVVVMRIDVPNALWSTNTTYGCYLVYKMSQDIVGDTILQMKHGDGRALKGQHHGIIANLSIHKRLLIRREGPDTINKIGTIQRPQKREDGWLELNLGNNSDIQCSKMHEDKRFNNFRRRFLPCISDYDSDNIYTLNSQYISTITIYMLPLCNTKDTATLILQGIEFRPM